LALGTARCDASCCGGRAYRFGSRGGERGYGPSLLRIGAAPARGTAVKRLSSFTVASGVALVGAPLFSGGSQNRAVLRTAAKQRAPTRASAIRADRDGARAVGAFVGLLPPNFSAQLCDLAKESVHFRLQLQGPACRLLRSRRSSL